MSRTHTREEQIERLNRSYVVLLATRCWEWQRAVADTGYGIAWFGGKLEGAHRVMYRLSKGEIPPKHELDHLCRNRRCVNPEHLEAVTRTVNARRGARSVLNTEVVAELKARNEQGFGWRRLSKMYPHINQHTIKSVLNGGNWANGRPSINV